MNKVEKWWEQIPKPEPPNSNIIYSCTFNTDGTMLFVVISDILVVYNAENGEVITKPTKAAKQPINCIAFAKDGKTFATGSNDRSCVLWRFNYDAEKKLEPILKLTQNDAILTLSFNPLTHELFSGGAADFALFMPGKKEIPKEKYHEKIISSAWSADGKNLAFGTINGTISLRMRSLEEKNEIKLEAPAWCMEWSPITMEHEESYLLVGCWDQTFYYFDCEGKPRERFGERHISCNPITVNFHYSGEYFLMTGTDKKVSLYSRDLGYLADITTLQDWSWSSKFRPHSQDIAMTTNSGHITVQQLAKKSVFSSHRELYARRENFTDVVVENIAINQKVRLKCKELVQKISIFKDKLAVLQSERLLIYVAAEEGIKYSPYRKITKKFLCDAMEILNSHVLFAKDSKLQVFNFLGELEREWMLDAHVSYLRTVGGPPKREHALVGLANGQVLKIFVDNSFPIQLYRSAVAVVKCDINVSKKRLAVLDANKNLVGFDLITQTQIFQEVNVSSFAWNSDLEDSIAFSSGGTISIKTSNLAPLNQKSDANIIGFEGFQLYISKGDSISVMDISQSTTLAKFVEKKDFSMAYKLACFGVPENDLRFLGLQALQNQDFEVAEKCFVRLKDMSLLDLTKKYLEEGKRGQKVNADLLKADLLAYQGKYQQASSLYIKGGRTEEAIQLFCQLKRYDQAQLFIRMSSSSDTKELLGTLYVEQAEWLILNGEWMKAGQLYIAIKQYKKALELYQKYNYFDGLIEICRIVDRDSNEALLVSCASLFCKHKEHAHAKEVYLKLNDLKSLMNLHIELEKWEEAFALAKLNKDLLDIVKLPYADYLLKNDRYEEALRAYKKINRPDLTQRLVTSFCRNAVNQRRFIDASRQYWALAVEEIKAIKDLKEMSEVDRDRYKKYEQYRDTSEVFYVYNAVAEFVETPFFTSSDAALYTILNACRFLITKIHHLKLPQINASYVYYSLAKLSAKLEGYKTARACYDKLSHLVVNSRWAEEMELGCLTVRSKPFSDKDNILPICSRCSMTNPLIADRNTCFNCKHPFIISFISFQVLPLVEFRPASGLSYSRIIELINSQKKQTKTGKKQQGKNDGWNQSISPNQQVLSLASEKQTTYSQMLKDRISETLDNQQMQVDYMPLVLSEQDISQLDTESVYVLDQRKINPTCPIRYFINLVQDLLLKCCAECGKFFLLDEYEFDFVQNKRCPYCNGEEKRSGRVKDIFDL